MGGDQPKVNAGSPTYPLDVSAALTDDRKRLTVAVVNPTESAQQMSLKIQGARTVGNSRMWRMTGPSPEAADVLGQKPQIKIQEISIAGFPGMLTLDPVSINIYEFDLQG